MNPVGLAILKSFEDCKLKAYQDDNLIWTIGWGDTFNVKSGHEITQQEADSRLKSRVEEFEALTKRRLRGVPLNDNQLSAVVDFVYNVGIGRFRGSELRAKLVKGDFQVHQEFLNWTRVNGKTGVLKARRECEWALFSGDLKTVRRLLADRGTPLEPGVA